MKQHIATQSAPAPLSYSIPDAAQAIGVGRSTIYELLNAGRIQSVHIGKRRLVLADSLKALLDDADQRA